MFVAQGGEVLLCGSWLSGSGGTARERRGMRFPESGARRRQEWDEDAWERFLKKEDMRTAKFQELFETLGDRPDRNQIIMKELRLQTPFEDSCGENTDCAQCPGRYDCEIYEMRVLAECPEDCAQDPEADEILAIFEEVERIPAYQIAHAFSLALHDYLSGWLHRMPSGRNSQYGDDVWGLLDMAALVPAQLAGGHGIGYDDDCICGNIANCKRALLNAKRCHNLLAELSLPESEASRLDERLDDVCVAITAWIEELRTRAA